LRPVKNWDDFVKKYLKFSRILFVQNISESRGAVFNPLDHKVAFWTRLRPRRLKPLAARLPDKMKPGAEKGAEKVSGTYC
jgi:hypothetical protein